MDAGRYRLLLGSRPALCPNVTIAPHVHFLDDAEKSLLQQSRGSAQSVLRRALIAHLRGDFHLTSNLTQLARLSDIVRERFLAEAMLAHFHRRAGDNGVHMIRRAY